MSRMVPAVADWMRQHVPWSNTRQAWAERLGICGVCLAVLFGIFFVREFNPILQLFYWGITLGAAAILLRGGWLKLFGPVFFLTCFVWRGGCGTF